MELRVEAEVRQLEPEPGDMWVRREFTGRKTLTVIADQREDWSALDEIFRAARDVIRPEKE